MINIFKISLRINVANFFFHSNLWNTVNYGNVFCECVRFKMFLSVFTAIFKAICAKNLRVALRKDFPLIIYYCVRINNNLKVLYWKGDKNWDYWKSSKKTKIHICWLVKAWCKLLNKYIFIIFKFKIFRTDFLYLILFLRKQQREHQPGFRVGNTQSRAQEEHVTTGTLGTVHTALLLWYWHPQIIFKWFNCWYGWICFEI